VRVPPPGLLKLEQEALLRDVRDRLAERMPSYQENIDDPTDPGWLLLEQAAWMVELLSEQLDQYPFAVVQHFIHMMGGHLLPAQPAIGSVIVEPASDSEMKVERSRPRRWRFFTQQSETDDVVEFVPVEADVPLRRARVLTTCELSSGELFTAGAPEGTEGIPAQMAWRGRLVRAGIFAHERVRFILVTNNAEKLRETLDKVVERFAKKNVGWLKLTVEDGETDNRLVLIAEPHVAGAFANSAPGDLTTGGDLIGDWGTLDGSTWTPQVELSNHPILPAHLRGTRPMPGPRDGTILIPDLIENFDVNDLLIRQASPLPETVVDAIWKTVGNMDTSLTKMKPLVKRSFGYGVETGIPQPTWVAGALECGAWSTLRRAGVTSAVHVDTGGAVAPDRLRFALLLDQQDLTDLPRMRVYSILKGGQMVRTPLKHKVVWRLPAPPRTPGGRMETLVAVDVTLTEETESVLLTVEDRPLCTMLNAMMVIQAPVVSDGRSVAVERNVPEGVSLLNEDLVTTGVIDRLLAGTLPRDASRHLKNFPVSSSPVDGREPIDDWEGVQLDASSGQLMLNAPDDKGDRRTLRPGTLVTFDWYRRTDGNAGNVSPNSISLVEQEVDARPQIYDVLNPVGTFFGMDRETEASATARLFSPAGGTPVLPADFERLVRQALGRKSNGWVVRCWTYAERALVSAGVWPETGPGSEPEAESQRLERELANAGPDTLLVVLGPQHSVIGDDQLDWARSTIKQEIRRQANRLPTVRDVIVTRFWPLTLECEGELDLNLPCFDPAEMLGEVTDSKGRTGEPRSVILLNAAVTEVISGEDE
jgi:hypothetical protein